jgi:hypothetical protein
MQDDFGEKERFLARRQKKLFLVTDKRRSRVAEKY